MAKILHVNMPYVLNTQAMTCHLLQYTKLSYIYHCILCLCNYYSGHLCYVNKMDLLFKEIVFTDNLLDIIQASGSQGATIYSYIQCIYMYI